MGHEASEVEIKYWISWNFPLRIKTLECLIQFILQHRLYLSLKLVLLVLSFGESQSTSYAYPISIVARELRVCFELGLFSINSRLAIVCCIRGRIGN